MAGRDATVDRAYWLVEGGGGGEDWRLIAGERGVRGNEQVDNKLVCYLFSPPKES
jgi:hypothetical protein